MSGTKQRSRRRARPTQTRLFRAPVSRTERITPGMQRVTLCGGDLGEFVNAGTDSHVVLYFYAEEAELPDPLTATTARAAFATVRPEMRSYTIRRFDVRTTELDIDFVLHAEAGPAATWARDARPGDELIFVGPSPAYEPDPEASGYLLIGDESALPAIQATLPELDPAIPVTVLVEIAGEAERQPMPVPVTWVHREGGELADPGRLRAALAGIELEPGLDVWLAGERTVMHELRRFLLEAGLPRDRVRPTTYWRAGT
ncbi:siderophore-interacting protein [Sciscionella marina]|uniref:siderophore-interacting protein n=1 Tax=Sciscionella marina TaxID=508770 RepID=UPI0012F7055C|nr:siderophore-interacting protein [Sciscionella marina]